MSSTSFGSAAGEKGSRVPTKSRQPTLCESCTDAAHPMPTLRLDMLDAHLLISTDIPYTLKWERSPDRVEPDTLAIFRTSFQAHTQPKQRQRERQHQHQKTGYEAAWTWSTASYGATANASARARACFCWNPPVFLYLLYPPQERRRLQKSGWGYPRLRLIDEYLFQPLRPPRPHLHPARSSEPLTLTPPHIHLDFGKFDNSPLVVPLTWNKNPSKIDAVFALSAV